MFIDEASRKRLSSALKALGDKDAPYLETTLDGLGRYSESRIHGAAPSVVAPKVRFNRVTGSGVSKVATVRVRHPAVLPFEFGRTKWKRRDGTIVSHYPGFRPQPFIGVKEQNRIVADVRDRARREIPAAIAREWERF